MHDPWYMQCMHSGHPGSEMVEPKPSWILMSVMSLTVSAIIVGQVEICEDIHSIKCHLQEVLVVQWQDTRLGTYSMWVRVPI